MCKVDWTITDKVCEMLTWVLQWNVGRFEKFRLPQAMFTNVLMQSWIDVDTENSILLIYLSLINRNIFHVNDICVAAFWWEQLITYVNEINCYIYKWTLQ